PCVNAWAWILLLNDWAVVPVWMRTLLKSAWKRLSYIALWYRAKHFRLLWSYSVSVRNYAYSQVDHGHCVVQQDELNIVTLMQQNDLIVYQRKQGLQRTQKYHPPFVGCASLILSVPHLLLYAEQQLLQGLLISGVFLHVLPLLFFAGFLPLWPVVLRQAPACALPGRLLCQLLFHEGHLVYLPIAWPGWQKY